MEKLSVQDHTTVRTDVTAPVALIHSHLRHENKLIEYQLEALRPWNDLKSPKRKAWAELCLRGIIFNLAGSSDGLFFKLPIVQMPTKKVLQRDCLCLVMAFISFCVTDDLASGSSNYLLISRRGRFVTCWSSDVVGELWLAGQGTVLLVVTGSRAPCPQAGLAPATPFWGLPWVFHSEERTDTWQLQALLMTEPPN